MTQIQSSLAEMKIPKPQQLPSLATWRRYSAKFLCSLNKWLRGRSNKTWGTFVFVKVISTVSSWKLLILLKIISRLHAERFWHPFRRTEFGPDWRISDGTEALQCVILRLWMSSRHTHAFQHVLTLTFMHPQTGNTLVNSHHSLLLDSTFDSRSATVISREASRDQNPLGLAGTALHPPAASQPVQVLWFTEHVECWFLGGLCL